MFFRKRLFTVIIIIWVVLNFRSLASDNLIIPKPVKVVQLKGEFILKASTNIIVESHDLLLRNIAQQCSTQVQILTDLSLPVRRAEKMKTLSNILYLNIDSSDNTIIPEGYRLTVKSSRITITGRSQIGVFYGVQSFLQMIPLKKMSRQIKISAIAIEDKPRFSWRGMHLDVSRHFFPIEFIKIYIDMMAMHKMNIFHWHLTDDQGWRIEIKRYPKLTEIGAWRVEREDRTWNDRFPQREDEQATYGGFYTQDEIGEIVEYARQRYITIVPEIEMPAHATAALAAYPQFSCTGGPFTVPAGGVWPINDIYCAGNDSTFEFLQNILTEVMDLFPGKFIHVGGDEADKTTWRNCLKCQRRIKEEHLNNESELQSYFIKRIEKSIILQGRRLIGWDEILEGGLAPEATVMSWRGMDGGIQAAREGHDVVMTPGSHCYFDHYQGKSDFEPVAIGGYSPLSKVYTFEPVPESLDVDQSKHILGAQANMWTEYIPTPAHAQYMALPRMAAMAEVLWSPKESRDWNAFALRVENLMKHYDKKGYNYSKSAYLVDISTLPDTMKKQAQIMMKTEIETAEIHYTLNGNNPTPQSIKYKKPFFVHQTVTIRSASFMAGKMVSNISEQKIFMHKAVFKPITITSPYTKYTGGGSFALLDGLHGSLAYNDGKWQGYEQNDCEVVIDLGENYPIHRLSTTYLQNTVSWIFYPNLVEYSVSQNGINFTSVAKFENPVALHHELIAVRELGQEFRDLKARYVKVSAQNIGVCPDWHGGKGGKSWVFIDEIVIE